MRGDVRKPDVMSHDRTHAHGRPTAHAASDDHAPKPGKHTRAEEHDRDDDHDDDGKGHGGADSSGVNMAHLQQFIGEHEGNIDHVYLDSRGFKTAGIGHLLAGTSYRVGQHVSAKQVATWFKQDVAGAIAGAKRKLGGAYDKLDEARKTVAIDMVFNLGEAGFGEFHRTIHAIQTGRFAEAASNMLQSLWAKQVGHRAVENAQIMRSGHFAGGGGTEVHAGGGGHEDRGGGGDHDEEHGGGDKHGSGGGEHHHGHLAGVRGGDRLLRAGSQGEAVRDVQRLLHVAPDGIFGDQTQHAVIAFQRKHHLAPDGIVGPLTLGALERRAHAKGNDHRGRGNDHDRDDDHEKDKDHGKDKGDHGEWTPAPPLDDVKEGVATLHLGHQGGSVRHVQKLLGVETDGKFGPGTRSAVRDFQHERDMKLHNGTVDGHTLHIIEKHPAGSVEGESREGSAQRQRLLSIAESGGAGRPDGKCYMHVCQFLVRCGGYGRIKNPYTQFPGWALPLAHNFADLMNSQGPGHWGLDRLSISNPYDAPAGAIVVVKAGSPGTAHPTAGDIAVADGNGRFYNGGLMGYSGREGWKHSPTAHLLGAYIPR